MDSKINRVETIPYSCPAVHFGYFLWGAVPFVSDRRVCSAQRELLPGSGCTYTRKRRSEERGKEERTWGRRRRGAGNISLMVDAEGDQGRAGQDRTGQDRVVTIVRAESSAECPT